VPFAPLQRQHSIDPGVQLGHFRGGERTFQM
jgi:hypothetical protein